MTGDTSFNGGAHRQADGQQRFHHLGGLLAPDKLRPQSSCWNLCAQRRDPPGSVRKVFLSLQWELDLSWLDRKFVGVPDCQPRDPKLGTRADIYRVPENSPGRKIVTFGGPLWACFWLSEVFAGTFLQEPPRRYCLSFFSIGQGRPRDSWNEWALRWQPQTLISKNKAHFFTRLSSWRFLSQESSIQFVASVLISPWVVENVVFWGAVHMLWWRHQSLYS